MTQTITDNGKLSKEDYAKLEQINSSEIKSQKSKVKSQKPKKPTLKNHTVIDRSIEGFLIVIDGSKKEDGKTLKIDSTEYNYSFNYYIGNIFVASIKDKKFKYFGELTKDCLTQDKETYDPFCETQELFRNKIVNKYSYSIADNKAIKSLKSKLKKLELFKQSTNQMIAKLR